MDSKISNLPEVTTPVDADVVPIVDSSTTSKLTWANIKATLKTYFDSLYGNTTSPATNTADYIPQWDGTNSKTLKNGLALTDIGGGGMNNLLKNGNFINNSTNGYGSTPDDWTSSNANPVQGGFPSMTKAELIALLGILDGDIEGLWNLNEDSGNALDLSSNGYNLTPLVTNVSQYPPYHSDTYVKATTKYDTSYWPYFATDPAKSLTGSWTNNSWVTGSGVATNQRFHIDLGSAITVKRIYYENCHDSGGNTTLGAKNFTFWGSNTAAAFADLTYATDTNWTQLTASQSTFDQHVAANQADPKYITITNTTAYRYYAVKIADGWSAGSCALRRIELQTTTTVMTSNDGLMGKARDFEKDNSEYFTIADASCANLEITGSRTIFAWVKPESLAQRTIMFKSDASISKYYGLHMADTSGAFRMNAIGLTTNTIVTSDILAEAGKWYFVCGVYDSANTKLKLWVNGTKKEVTASGSSTDTDGAFNIGSFQNASAFWDGLIQNAGVLSVALTDAQVGLLMNYTYSNFMIMF